MAARVSRGCFRCRTRRVKCDLGQPSCKHCIRRGEDCVGYRDDATLLFKSENENVAKKVRRRASVGNTVQASQIDISHTHNAELTINQGIRKQFDPMLEDQAITKFFDKYVIYPCNERSSLGFLEHLPSLFSEVEVEGRFALRWAVRAAAYASFSVEEDQTLSRHRALHCYGLALSALGDALSNPKRAPDDYTLMTVVVLDIFESMYLPESVEKGAHAGGMAQILRLRGVDNIHGARGWSLFRLSHHRIQKQQLAFRKKPLPESEVWVAHLQDAVPYDESERSSLRISQTCQRARILQASLSDSTASIDQVLDMVFEMHELDHMTTTWRDRPEWRYNTIARSLVFPTQDQSSGFPNFVQLHGDVWLAYEWNYHRTARIILHTHLLETIKKLQSLIVSENTLQLNIMSSLKELSVLIIRTLVDDILSTVPQSLGEIDHAGNALEIPMKFKLCSGVGGYFLLWPIKISKENIFVTIEQSAAAQTVFERIRECTGMKSCLGDASII